MTIIEPRPTSAVDIPPTKTLDRPQPKAPEQARPHVDEPPILPTWLRDRETFRSTTRNFTRRNSRRALRWLWKGPELILKLLLLAPRGLWRVSVAVGKWVYDQDSAALRHEHAGRVETAEYARAQAVRRANLHARALVVATVALVTVGPVMMWTVPYVLSALVGAVAGAWLIKLIPGRSLTEVVVAAALGVALWYFLPVTLFTLVPRPPAWVAWAVGALVVLALGWAGRNRDKALVANTEVVAPGIVLPLRAPMVREALCSLGIAGLNDKVVDDIRLLNDIHRYGPGVQVDVELPGGVTAAAVVERREKLAAALKRELGCVWPAVGRRHAAHLSLYVSDEPLVQQRQKPWPLAEGRQVDIFDPLPQATDQRGEWVSFRLAYSGVVIGAIPRMGKALALDTPVPTPSGWTTMGELRDGDEVFDETGRVCRVVEAHAIRYGRPCYEVVFSDGSVIVADAEHLWQVETRSTRVNGRAEKVLTTADMLGSLRVEADQRLNYSVRVAGALQTPEVDLPVAPYTLGAWLGDGTTVNSSITVGVGDEQVLDEIRAEGYNITERASARESGRAPVYNVTGLMTQLRVAGVLGDKHIPAAYFRASEAQRRALLAGLLDTAGWCEKWGTVRFVATRQRLAEDVRRLVATLGYVSTMRSRTARLDGQQTGMVREVTFCPDVPVFRMPRKVERQSTKRKASNKRRFIVDIRPVESVPVRCITVDSPNSLYLVGEQCIPTHNTFALRQLLIAAGLDPRTKVYALDGKGTGDLAPTRLFAHFYSVGDEPEEVEERVLPAFRELRAELRRRAKMIRELPREECPESKVTSALADKHRSLAPIVIGIDETQAYFGYGEKKNKAHQAIRDEFTAIVTDLVKRGPALGFICVLATQNVCEETIPRQIGTNAAIRCALKLFDHTTNDQVLGTGAYSRGIDATAFDIEDKGLMWLRADGDQPQIVRSVAGLDTVKSEEIAAKARAIRERKGRLTGEAAGEVAADEAAQVDLLADCRQVVGSSKAVLLDELREGLAGLRSETWGHLDNAALGSMLNAAGVKRGTVYSTALKREGYGVKAEWLNVAATADEDPGDDESIGAVINLSGRR